MRQEGRTMKSQILQAMSSIATHTCSRYRCRMSPDACVLKRTQFGGALACKGCTEAVGMDEAERQASRKPVFTSDTLNHHPGILEKLPTHVEVSCPECKKTRKVTRAYGITLDSGHQRCSACRNKDPNYGGARRGLKITHMCEGCGTIDSAKFEYGRKNICIQCRKKKAAASMRESRKNRREKHAESK